MSSSEDVSMDFLRYSPKDFPGSSTRDLSRNSSKVLSGVLPEIFLEITPERKTSRESFGIFFSDYGIPLQIFVVGSLLEYLKGFIQEVLCGLLQELFRDVLRGLPCFFVPGVTAPNIM